MIAAWGTFSVIDTSAKFLVMAAIPAVQVAFMRYAVQFLFTVIEGSRDGMTVIRSLDRTTLVLLTLRGSLLVVSTFFNFVACEIPIPDDDGSNHVFVANFRRIVFNSVPWGTGWYLALERDHNRIYRRFNYRSAPLMKVIIGPHFCRCTTPSQLPYFQ